MKKFIQTGEWSLSKVDNQLRHWYDIIRKVPTRGVSKEDWIVLVEKELGKYGYVVSSRESVIDIYYKKKKSYGVEFSYKKLETKGDDNGIRY